jgi:hypothetical protein
MCNVISAIERIAVRKSAGLAEPAIADQTISFIVVAIAFAR